MTSPNSLMPVVYDELRRIAAGYIRRERPGQTLQATALVNEAFVRLGCEQPGSCAKRENSVAGALHPARAAGADAAGDGARQRGVCAAGVRTAAIVREPSALCRDRCLVDAADS